jgi:hypothetical protein
MSWSSLGNDIITSVMLVSPCYCYVSLILLVWRIGFGVTSLELRSVDFDSSGLCPVDSRKPVVDIIPKSKDRFMDRLVGNEWVREWTLPRTTWRKRGPLVIWTDTSDENSAGML